MDLDAGTVAPAAVIGVVVSLIMEAAKQVLPATWFRGAIIPLVTFAASVLVTVVWYWLGGMPDVASWQEAMVSAIIAFAIGQTFYGTARPVGLQRNGAPPHDDVPVVVAVPVVAPQPIAGAGAPDPNGAGRPPAPASKATTDDVHPAVWPLPAQTYRERAPR